MVGHVQLDEVPWASVLLEAERPLASDMVRCVLDVAWEDGHEVVGCLREGLPSLKRG